MQSFENVGFWVSSVQRRQAQITSNFGLQFLTPIVTSIALTVIVALCARSRHLILDDADVYQFPKVLGYLMALCGALLFVPPSCQGWPAPEMAA